MAPRASSRNGFLARCGEGPTGPHGSRRRLLGLLFMLLPALLASDAARASDRLLTLAAALEAARTEAPLLRAAGFAAEASQRALEAARAARLGRIDGGIGLTHYSDDVIVRPMSRDLVAAGLDGLPFDRDQLVAGAGFSVPVFTAGRLDAEIDAAEAESRRAALGQEITEEELLEAVRVLYTQAQVQAAQLRAIEAQIDVLQSREEDLALAVDIGRTAAVDLHRLRAGIAEVQSAGARVAARYEGAAANLFALIGRLPGGDEEILLESPPEAIPAIRAEDAEMARMIGESAAIQSVSASEEAALARARTARAERLPQVMLAGNWRSYWAPSVDGRLETWQIGLEVTVPVFDGGARRARQAEATLRTAEAGARVDAALLQARAELHGALARWDAAAARVAAAATRLSATQEVESVENVRWQTGAGTLRDLLEAEADRLAAEAELIAARGDVRIAAAEINRLTGREVVS